MADRAAHLLDHVFPDVPVRQCVVSLPYRLRYELAWNHDTCRGVVAVFVRAVLKCLRARARHDGIVDSRGGADLLRLQQGTRGRPSRCSPGRNRWPAPGHDTQDLPRRTAMSHLVIKGDKMSRSVAAECRPRNAGIAADVAFLRRRDICLATAEVRKS